MDMLQLGILKMNSSSKGPESSFLLSVLPFELQKTQQLFKDMLKFKPTYILVVHVYHMNQP